MRQAGRQAGIWKGWRQADSSACCKVVLQHSLLGDTQAALPTTAAVPVPAAGCWLLLLFCVRAAAHWSPAPLYLPRGLYPTRSEMFSSAKSMRICLFLNMVLLRLRYALSASSLLWNSQNPKPLGLPVSRSMMSLHRENTEDTAGVLGLLHRIALPLPPPPLLFGCCSTNLKFLMLPICASRA